MKIKEFGIIYYDHPSGRVRITGFVVDAKPGEDPNNEEHLIPAIIDYLRENCMIYEGEPDLKAISVVDEALQRIAAAPGKEW
ncbi:hypothetical protein P2G56_17480 [Cronobacter malonaticus]|uniref:hypothetical protein n=1 Tax=Cronobacter malonaticus TaxID=413503 RepID=UPI002DC0330E|nr:hypothetical protein [Cronobacter malonaticus]MEB8480204.1 hypothetical protein [Cronobacter malonaticus]